MSEVDSFFVTLTQHTPHVDNLAEKLYRKQFLSTREHTNNAGTQYMKSRRLYDRLFQNIFNYSETEKDSLKKIFYDTGNGYASEILFSAKNPIQINSAEFWQAALHYIPLDVRKSGFNSKNGNLRITTASVLQIFAAAKVGNASKVDNLMKEAAGKCVIMNLPVEDLGRGKTWLDKLMQGKLSLFRASLRNVLLNKRDWSDKTLLHIAATVKTCECVEVILKYAQEAGIKGELLDSRDVFGRTPLHLSLQRKSTRISQKLIIEGANVYSMDNKNEFPLQIIYQTFPKMALCLMDKAVTVTGDISCDALCLNIDFGIISVYINLNQDLPAKAYGEPTKRQGFLEEKYCKSSDHVLDLEDSKQTDSILPLRERVSAPSLPKLHRRGEEMQTLISLVLNNGKACNQILSHPVARLFLLLKWNRLKRFVQAKSVFRIFFCLIYLLVTFRIYFIDCPYGKERKPKTNETSNSVKYYESNEACVWSPLTMALLPIILMLNLVFLASESLKVTATIRRSKGRTYWFLHLGMGVLGRILFFSIATVTTVAPYYQRHFHSFQYLVAAIGIHLASLLLVQIIGDSNMDFWIHSIYVYVYTRVVRRFLSVLATFSAMILGFAISFCILFPKSAEFSSFAKSIFRLLIMIHGEFDFEDKSLESEVDGDLWMFWSGQVLYVLFGSGITLVLIDVFLGYTVSDINELKCQAEDLRRCIQIEQLFYTETWLASLKRIFKKVTKVDDKRFQFSVISSRKSQRNRYDALVRFEKIPEEMQAEFRELLL